MKLKLRNLDGIAVAARLVPSLNGPRVEIELPEGGTRLLTRSELREWLAVSGVDSDGPNAGLIGMAGIGVDPQYGAKLAGEREERLGMARDEPGARYGARGGRRG